MVIFNSLLPLLPAEGALRAEGDGVFASKNIDWIPFGYRLDTVWIWFWIGLRKNIFSIIQLVGWPWIRWIRLIQTLMRVRN